MFVRDGFPTRIPHGLFGPLRSIPLRDLQPEPAVDFARTPHDREASGVLEMDQRSRITVSHLVHRRPVLHYPNE